MTPPALPSDNATRPLPGQFRDFLGEMARPFFQFGAFLVEQLRPEALAKSPAVGQVGGMTTVARCLTIDRALFMRSLLEGCGLKAYVPDELTAQTDPVIFFGSMNSIRVQVDDDDAVAARAILAQNGLPAET